MIRVSNQPIIYYSFYDPKRRRKQKNENPKFGRYTSKYELVTNRKRVSVLCATVPSTEMPSACNLCVLTSKHSKNRHAFYRRYTLYIYIIIITSTKNASRTSLFTIPWPIVSFPTVEVVHILRATRFRPALGRPARAFPINVVVHPPFSGHTTGTEDVRSTATTADFVGL